MSFDITHHSAGRLTIDLAALRRNYALCCEKTGLSCEVGAAVKADAYGLGCDKVAPSLYDAGCRLFFVATLDEGIALREIFSKGDKPEARIAVLNGLALGCAEIFDFYSLTPVLNSISEIDEWVQYANRTRPHLKSMVHVDTGMARLGLCADEQAVLIQKAAHYTKTIDIEYIISHFSCADEPQDSHSEQQLKQLEQMAAAFPFSKLSIANSAGLFRDARYHGDMVRPGMCLYGLNPTPQSANPMTPVATLDVPVLQVRTLKSGQSVGYGASWHAEKDTRLATIQIGYADGFLRSLSNRGTLYWQNMACPVVGRVSMDLVVVSLDNVPEALLPKPGDRMEVIGTNQSADDLARLAGTIGYEILTALGRRYRRHYLK